ncbi:TadE family protein [Brachybacterium sp. DNPG3]
MSRSGRRSRALADDTGSAVAEFPLVAVLVVMIALAVIQASLIMHTRNTLIDAAVRGAHHAALMGAGPEDGAERAEQILDGRLGDALGVEATGMASADGTITVRISATLPLVGVLGPSAGLVVEGHAIDEGSW